MNEEGDPDKLRHEKEHEKEPIQEVEAGSSHLRES